MIDHLLRFTDEATAQADPVVGKYYTPASAGGFGGWRGDVVIPNVSVYALAPDGVTRVPFVGWFLIVSLAGLAPELRDLPNGACRLVADRALANSPNFILYTAADVTAADLQTAHVEPLFAGSRYPFSGAP